MSEAQGSLFDRTFGSMRRAWRRTAGLTQVARTRTTTPDINVIRDQIDACLQGRGGEVSARARAAELGETYLTLDDEGRLQFLDLLASDYGPDRTLVDKAIAARAEAEGDVALLQAEEQLRKTLEAPRLRLFSQFTGLDLGVKFLVNLRGEVRERLHAHPQLKALDQDLLRLLSAWFDVGLLELRRITWETSAAVLEKLIAYEAVHEIQSWQDLKHRLADDRRCFAFFHPNMLNEPLIFVEVALVNGIADNVQSLLDEKAPRGDPAAADTAIFYSISNCQPGLAGVSFGDFLIKRVASELSQSLPKLKTFATLSPIPGFNRWLRKRIDQDALSDDSKQMFDEAETQWLAKLDPEGSPGGALRQLMVNSNLEAKDGEEANSIAERVESILLRLCAQYLTSSTDGQHKRALDPVAHFHLSNGARVERINWNGDRSSRGLAQSAGMMVNYLYKLSEIEKNHEYYKGSGRIVCSSAVRKLARY